VPEEVKPVVERSGEEEKVYLPLCRRIAGRVVCVEKGIEVVYRSSEKPVLKEIRVHYPKEGEGGELIYRTLVYQKGKVGPVEVIHRYEEERK